MPEQAQREEVGSTPKGLSGAEEDGGSLRNLISAFCPQLYHSLAVTSNREEVYG